MISLILDFFSLSANIEPRDTRTVAVRVEMQQDQIYELFDEIPLAEHVKWIKDTPNIIDVAIDNFLEIEDMFDRLGATESKNRLAQWLIDQG